MLVGWLMVHSFRDGMHFVCSSLWFIAHHDTFTFYYGCEFHQNLLHFAVQDGCLATAAAVVRVVVYLLTALFYSEINI